MSHFDGFNTKFIDKDCLVKALKNLGYRPEEGGEIHGYGRSHTQVELRFRPTRDSYDIGFRKHGGRYVCVADWFGVRGIQLRKFLESLTREYLRVHG